VQSRVKKLDKIEKFAAPKRRETLEFEFRPRAPARTSCARRCERRGERVVFRGSTS